MWELAFTSVGQSCDHNLSSWPLDLRTPQAQLREIGGAREKEIILLTVQTQDAIDKASTLEPGSLFRASF